MISKNQQIKDSLSATREKRKTQTCKVYELKLSENKLNVSQIEFLNSIFIEAKWVYNDILNFNDLKNYAVSSTVKVCGENVRLQNFGATFSEAENKQENLRC